MKKRQGRKSYRKKENGEFRTLGREFGKTKGMHASREKENGNGQDQRTSKQKTKETQGEGRRCKEQE